MTTTTSTSRRSSSNRARLRIRSTVRADGDLHRVSVPYGELERRRRGIVDLPWTMLDQRHGTTVVRVTAPGVGDGEPGDIAITDRDGAVLGCWTADCAPVVLVGDDREFAVVHAGWRGLAAGVVDAAVSAFREPVRTAVLGPTIGPCCYEFGRDELADVARGVHAPAGAIAATTRDGAPALDVPAAVRAACRRHGIALTSRSGCSACDGRHFSHRVGRERGRHVTAVWRPPAETVRR